MKSLFESSQISPSFPLIGSLTLPTKLKYLPLIQEFTYLKDEINDQCLMRRHQKRSPPRRASEPPFLVEPNVLASAAFAPQSWIQFWQNDPKRYRTSNHITLLHIVQNQQKQKPKKMLNDPSGASRTYVC